MLHEEPGVDAVPVTSNDCPAAQVNSETSSVQGSGWTREKDLPRDLAVDLAASVNWRARYTSKSMHNISGSSCIVTRNQVLGLSSSWYAVLDPETQNRGHAGAITTPYHNARGAMELARELGVCFSGPTIRSGPEYVLLRRCTNPSFGVSPMVTFWLLKNTTFTDFLKTTKWALGRLRFKECARWSNVSTQSLALSFRRGRLRGRVFGRFGISLACLGQRDSGPNTSRGVKFLTIFNFLDDDDEHAKSGVQAEVNGFGAGDIVVLAIVAVFVKLHEDTGPVGMELYRRDGDEGWAGVRSNGRSAGTSRLSLDKGGNTSQREVER
ncbi:hypothetical protein EDB92DRAFT_1818991 [Lactarius akahatsu]|uniref:Uncharacterized protein n=1 Tax=Lactarius akahatsu TaxID=416441 RepID=A0AAD4LEW7_9AGAM|nr:hypothetical protein EDB92DRAFT_1818991 [Lactarius akahatsu]